ncbi:hypothetical protein M5689_008167 [Euphorbia peplus]|nr:hypothetical protein M5689_008167 [Euphorbia peplus]
MNKASDVRAVAFSRGLRSSSKPLPKRGEIKKRIAANAFHSIVSVLSRGSSNQHPSQKKRCYREGNK